MKSDPVVSEKIFELVPKDGFKMCIYRLFSTETLREIIELLAFIVVGENIRKNIDVHSLVNTMSSLKYEQDKKKMSVLRSKMIQICTDSSWKSDTPSKPINIGIDTLISLFDTMMNHNEATKILMKTIYNVIDIQDIKQKDVTLNDLKTLLFTYSRHMVSRMQQSSSRRAAIDAKRASVDETSSQRDTENFVNN